METDIGLAAGFDRVSLRYDLNYICEPVAAEVLDNRLRGRPNPSMPSLHEAAVAVLGDGASEFLDGTNRW